MIKYFVVYTDLVVVDVIIFYFFIRIENCPPAHVEDIDCFEVAPPWISIFHPP